MFDVADPIHTLIESARQNSYGKVLRSPRGFWEAQSQLRGIVLHLPNFLSFLFFVFLKLKNNNNDDKDLLEFDVLWVHCLVVNRDPKFTNFVEFHTNLVL